MKQTYYTLRHQAVNAGCWVSTSAASKEILQPLMDLLQEKGKKMKMEEVEFDNYFTHKGFGPGSEFHTLNREGFANLRDTYDCRQSLTGTMYCLEEYKNHPEVKEAVDARSKGMASASDSYYSRPWV